MVFQRPVRQSCPQHGKELAGFCLQCDKILCLTCNQTKDCTDGGKSVKFQSSLVQSVTQSLCHWSNWQVTLKSNLYGRLPRRCHSNTTANKNVIYSEGFLFVAYRSTTPNSVEQGKWWMPRLHSFAGAPLRDVIFSGNCSAAKRLIHLSSTMLTLSSIRRIVTVAAM